MPVCSWRERERGRKKNVKDNGAMALTPSERRMIQTIRELKFGTVTVNIQDYKIMWIKREENIKIE